MSAYDEPAEELAIAVGHQRARPRIDVDAGDRGQPGGQFWDDGAEPPVKKAAGIAITVLANGEAQYRRGALYAHAWRIERKAASGEEIRMIYINDNRCLFFADSGE